MKKIKHILIPMGFGTLYLLAALAASQFIHDTVFVTAAANLVIILIGYWYYYTAVGDICLPVPGWSVCLSAAALIPLWFCLSLTSTAAISSGADMGAYSELTPEQTGWYLVLSIFIAPLAEEILFRGILFRHLRQAIPVGFAYVISSVLFGLAHGTFVHLYIGFVCGMFFAIVYEYTGKLGASVMLHAGYNLMTALLVGISLPSWFFSWPFLLFFNLLVLSLLVLTAALVFATQKDRMNRQVVSGQKDNKLAKFLRRVVPGYAGPVDVTVEFVTQCFMPENGLIVDDVMNNRLYAGVISGLESSQFMALKRRRVCANSGFIHINGNGVGAVGYLVLRVL